jgi:tetratricopeptide (TPR) repeat protein
LRALAEAESRGLLRQGFGSIELHPWTEKRFQVEITPEVQAAVEGAVCREARQLNEEGQATRLLAWQGLLRSVVERAKNRWDEPAADLCEILAEHLRQLGEQEDARLYLERAVEIRESLGKSSALAGTLESLGRLFQEEGDLVEARVAYEKALLIREKAEPGDSIALPATFYHLGLLVRSRGEHAAARQYFESALAIFSDLRGPDHPDTVAARNQLQALLGEQLLAEQEFSRLVPWGSRFTHRLLTDGAILAGIKTVGPSRWLFRVQLPKDLQESFGTAPQVLILVATGEIQGKDLQTAQQELQKDDLDLDPDLLIVVDDRPGLKERLERLPLLWGQWIPWPVSAGEFPPLAGQLRRHLPLFDVFEKRDPVRGRQVIGRQEVISDLRKRLQGCEAVGVFGLRKVGKTSVVRAVTDRLDPLSAISAPRSAQRETHHPSARVIWIDVERLVE